MSDVVLSSATRSSIIELQQIAKRMDMLQTRLATGKRVNSASDDPAAFFTSMAMNARSATLNSLLTNMATAQGAVDATNKGIAAIQSLLSSAQNVANQALQSANTLVTVTGNNSTALTAATVIASSGGSSTKFKAGDTVTVNDGTTTATYTAVNNDTVQTVLNAINNTANLKAVASLNSAGQIQLQATSGVNITIGGTLNGSGTLNGIIGLTAGTTTFTANSLRQNLATQFDALRTQIDQAAQDTGFNGVNLLTSGSLSVTFNETGSSKLTITGAQLTSSGLGVAATTGQFQADTDVNAALSNVTKALTTMQTQSALFGSNASIVQTRTDFTKAMINALNDGADALVATDTNADGAALLALQTASRLRPWRCRWRMARTARRCVCSGSDRPISFTREAAARHCSSLSRIAFMRRFPPGGIRR
jgi:flagellin